MNIGQFVMKFPTEGVEIYGSERITYILCRELLQIGNNVSVFVPYDSNRIESYEGLTVYFYKSLFRIQNYYFSYHLLHDPMKKELEIAHVHNDSPMAMLAGSMCAKKKGIPLIVTWHGDWIGHTTVRKAAAYLLNTFLTKRVLSQANAIILPSISYLQETKILKEYKKKIVEIPHGISLDEAKVSYSKDESRTLLGLGKNKTIVLYVGSVIEAKGVGVLLKAIPNVIKANEDFLFVFVGGGNVNKFEELAKELGVQKYVKFTGYVEERVKYLYYNSADVFVFPSMSKHEVFPVVTIEPSAFGLPIVASDLNTLKSIIRDGYNGIYFKKGNEESLANALTYLLKNEDVRNRIGKNARKMVENKFNTRIMAEKTYRLYNEVVSEKMLPR